MTSPDPITGKPAFRIFLRRQLRAMPDPDAQSAAIRRHLAGWIGEWTRRQRRPPMVAAFAALPGEPDLLALVGGADGGAAASAHWCFPRIDGDLLGFAAINSPGELRRGIFGIPEPDPATPALAGELIDIVLCPGLGFTPGGLRLGRGRGYYDRFLAGLAPDCPRIGVAFREQILPELPAEPHDLRMTHLASADGVHPAA